MRDSIALVLALALPPRPEINHIPVFINPQRVVPLVVKKQEEEPVRFTTCYQSSNGSCWSQE